jgi:lysophospholipase L1-like esterase
MRKIFLGGIFFLFMCILASTADTVQKKITVFTIGDSTMAHYDSTKDLRCGWAEKLPLFFNENVTIANFAKSGRSSKSFIDEGLWQEVITKVQPGDYVIIQFGHNDEKYKDPKRYTQPWTTYSDNLKRFATETREKGGLAILCTPIVRRSFESDGSVKNSHGEYPDAARKVAADMKIPLVDLTNATKKLVESYGPENSKKLYNYVSQGESPLYPEGNSDDTHLNALGAAKVAELAVLGLQKIKNPLACYIIITADSK